MKRIVYYLAAVLCLAGMAACQEKTPDPEPENPPVTDDLGNTWVTTDCVTPVTYAEGGYNAASTGVSIDITANEAHNIKFVCTPGEDIKSYTINVYPLALLYSELDNTRRTGQKETLSADETEDMVAPTVSMLYSKANVVNSLMEKVAAKCAIDPKPTVPEHTGRSVDELRAKLNTIKNYI